MNRKGELTSTQLATLVIVIVGFAIAVIFLWSVFGNKDLTERDVCRLSILSRATVPGVVQQEVPLSCFTEKICITREKSFIDNFNFNGLSILKGSDKSDCEQFSGENNVRDVKIDLSNTIKASEEIQREVANAMYDCWIMAGQGKLDIFSGKESYSDNVANALIGEGLEWASLKLPEIKPACLVCSRVAFSNEIVSDEKWVEVAKEINYNKFISTSKVPRSEKTYVQAFTDEGVGGYGVIERGESELAKYFGKEKLSEEEVKDVKNILLTQVKGNQEEIGKINGLSDADISAQLKGLSAASNSSHISIVFTQIKVPSVEGSSQFWDTFQNGAILGGAAAISGPGKVASFFLPGPGWVKLISKIATIGAVSFSLAYDSESTTVENQALSTATCRKFESTIEGEQRGCSLVKLINWDISTVNGLCTGGIEGNL